MKKFLAVMILAVFAFTACNKDDNDDNYVPRKPAATFAGKLLEKFGDYSYKYDEFGRCKALMDKNDDIIIDINYDKSIAVIHEKLLADIKFNKQGYIEKINGDLSEEGKSYTVIATFSYNKAGQPVAASHNYTKKDKEGETKRNWECSFTWENNNLKTAKYIIQQTIKGVLVYEDNSIYTYTYGETHNKAHQNTFAQFGYLGDIEEIEILGQTGLLGKATALFPVSVHCAYTVKALNTNGEITERPYEFEDPIEYKLNEDGTIDVETIDGDDYEYSYTTIGDK